ncbi:hypothetical protein JY651_21220 [Pyxidicoccus parkwayensis]|uniref:Lipoprotein n=1 Tax=Pyxidicoccus parkwayensis TaxID=2813578 RepID=A0ABX7P9U0_9BACT|nr:hypothetical protein [Pyxidicoccus parkwaysis]QSQ27278.1 hypothetical protein JY651_21220 [Pyxidicoccus parkwaysis]
MHKTSRFMGSAVLLAAAVTGCAGSAPEADASQEAPSQQASELSGSRVWSTPFSGIDGINGLAVQPDGHAAILGTSTSDIVVARFDPHGQLLWSKRFGDFNYQQATSIAVDSSGNLVISGDYWGELDFGGGALPCPGSPGNPRAFVAKLDANGGHLWSRCFGDGGQQQMGGLAVGPGGDVFISGYFGGTIDFGDGPVQAEGASDQFVARLDSRGRAEWHTAYDAGTSGLGALAVDGRGNVFVSGGFVDAIRAGTRTLVSDAGFNAYVLKLDRRGAPQWAKSFGAAQNQTAWRLAADATGNVVGAGAFLGTVDFGGGPLTASGMDVFAVSLDGDGNHRWSHGFGGPGADWGFDVGLDPAGNVLITGAFQGTVDFGAGPLVSAGGDDIFVAKLSRSGQTLWSRGFGDFNNQAAFRVAAAGKRDAVLWGRLSGTVDFGAGPVTDYSSTGSVVARITPE